MATAVVITAVVCSLMMFIIGTLFGALLTVCISRWNKKERSSKPAPSTQEQHPVSTEEVRSHKIELEENMAYGPVAETSEGQITHTYTSCEHLLCIAHIHTLYNSLN